MDTKPARRPPATSTRENFLAEAVGARQRRLTYMDGFRLGLGFMVAVLFVVLVLGGLIWAAVALLHLA